MTRHNSSDAPSPYGAGVQVEHLTWRPYGRRQPVLRDVTLEIAPGERVLLVGPSGSGKSTLLRAIAGLLLTADSGDLTGEVCVGGVPPQSLAGLVGLVLQDPGAGVVASNLLRDVEFGLENLGTPAAQMAQPALSALREVRLDLDPLASPQSLSGGEQQRLALAGALAMQPRLLLLDEPLAMLDPETATVVRDVVAEVVARRGLTLVVVEHRLGPWLDHVDRLVVLGPAGSTVADGAPSRVLADQADDLLAAGIWVPGRPDPQPLPLDLDWDPPAVGADEAVASADAVTATHRSRPLSGGVGPPRVTVAVHEASLDVRAGQLTALVGSSGAGKSSLMATVGGLLEPSAGVVRWASTLTAATGDLPPHRLPSLDLARRVAWVPQRAESTLLARRVDDEVLATARALGLDEATSRRRADVLLDALGLTPLARADPRQISGGEQRRLAVAAAALHQPALFLADEPTVGQDRHTWAAVMGIVDSLRAAGSAVLVTTHDPGVTARADVVELVTAPVMAGPGASATTSTGKIAVPLAARCGPLALLLAALLVLPLPLVLRSWRDGLAVVAVELVLGVVALWAPGGGERQTGRLRGVARRLVAPAVAVVSVGWSTWLLGGHDLALASGAGLRVLSLVLPSVFLLPYVDPDALGDALAQRLHLPARSVVAFSAALQRFQSFGALWSEIALARRVRGVGGGRSVSARARDVAATTLGLFVGVLGDAAALALAMDARGFAGAQHRTWAGGAPWRRADTFLVLSALLPVITAVAVRPLW